MPQGKFRPQRNNANDGSFPPASFRSGPPRSDFGADRSQNQVSAKVLQFKEKLRQGTHGARRPAGFGQGGKAFRGKGGQKKLSPLERRRAKVAKKEKEEETLHESMQEYLREETENAKGVATRYNPSSYTESDLKPTWPALPTAGNKASVSETVNWLSDNFVGSYNPPRELAKRVYEGDRVSFADEAERNEVMRVVKEIAAERAPKNPDNPDAAVEPEPINFEAIGEGERKQMIEVLLRGGYEKNPDSRRVENLSVLANVARNLSNNHTYRSTATAKILAKLEKGLPAAKPAAKPAAR